ncbi:hypothetical protein [Streptomyces sp. NPDC088925]|uniref:hypothetical protein n=1 Tax=Streptomyces sp. NPDC088925 TaxID=3365914 RepID=UPI00381BE433
MTRRALLRAAGPGYAPAAGLRLDARAPKPPHPRAAAGARARSCSSATSPGDVVPAPDCGTPTCLGPRHYTTATLLEDTGPVLGAHTPVFCARAPHSREDGEHIACLGTPAPQGAASYLPVRAPERGAYLVWWVWADEAPGDGRPVVGPAACRRGAQACLLPAGHSGACPPARHSALGAGIHPREVAAVEPLAAGVRRARLHGALGWPEPTVADVLGRLKSATGTRRGPHLVHTLLSRGEIRPPAITTHEPFPVLDDNGRDLLLALATSPQGDIAPDLGLTRIEARRRLQSLRGAAWARSDEHLVGLAHAWRALPELCPAVVEEGA